MKVGYAMDMKFQIKILAKILAQHLVSEDLFDSTIDSQKSRILFKKYVTHVELENHNYCNRSCSFCINSLIDRRKKPILMNSTVFERIIKDLSSIDYSEGIFWTRYHEPLAEPSIFERLRYAKKHVPKAVLVIFTNGDFLNRDVMARLEEVGLDRLRISLYSTPNNYTKILNNFLIKNNLDIEPFPEICGFRVNGTGIPSTYLSLPLFSTETPGQHTSSRGGAIPLALPRDYHRGSVCFNPIHSVNIDYNGKGVLCCHLSSDFPRHKNAIFDTISNQYGLFELYRDYSGFRAKLLHAGKKPAPCDKCNVNDSPFLCNGRNEIISKILRNIPQFYRITSSMDTYLKKAQRKFY